MFILALGVLLPFCLFSASTPQYEPKLHQVFVPAKYVAVMNQHILTIHKNGWGELNQDDFYHGHLVLKPQANSLKEPLAVKKLFEESVGVLYHSDEHLQRWSREDSELPSERKRPRSFFGYWDGSVVRVDTLLANAVKTTAHYVCCGTVHEDELAAERPNEFAFWRGYQVSVPSNKPCYVNLIIDFYYSSIHPPMIEVDGKKYTMTMDCKTSSW